MRWPASFAGSDLERAGLMVVVMKLIEFDEIHSNEFRDGKLILPRFLEDRNFTEIQESTYHGRSVEHDFALVTPDTDDGKHQNNKQKTPRRRRLEGPRSLMGCLTCRQSHVKCDEVKESCGRCTKLGRNCVYDRLPSWTYFSRRGFGEMISSSMSRNMYFVTDGFISNVL